MLKKCIPLLIVGACFGALVTFGQFFSQGEERKARSLTEMIGDLSHQDPGVRQAAERYILQIPDISSKLVTLLESQPEKRLQRKILYLFSRQDKSSAKAEQVLKLAKQTPEVEIFIDAFELLKMYGYSQQQLQELLTERSSFLLDELQNPEIPQAIELFLTNYLCSFVGKEVVVPEILQRLQGDPSQLSLITLLGKLAAYQACPFLESSLQDFQVDLETKMQIIKSLGMIAHPHSLVALEKFEQTSVGKKLRPEIQAACEKIKLWQTSSSSLAKDSQTQAVLDKINSFVQKLESYTLNNHTVIEKHSATGNSEPSILELEGKIQGVAHKKLLIAQTIQATPPRYVYLSFDGQYEWLYTGERKIPKEYHFERPLQRVDLYSMLKTELPFNPSRTTGCGLLSGKGYVGTIQAFLQIYDLRWQKQMPWEEQGKVVKLAGRVRIFPLLEYFAQSGQLATFQNRALLYQLVATFAELHLFVHPEEGRVVAWKIIGEEDSPLQEMFFRVNQWQANPQFAANAFTPTLSSPELVKDITSQLTDFFDNKNRNRQQSLVLLEKLKKRYQDFAWPTDQQGGSDE